MSYGVNLEPIRSPLSSLYERKNFSPPPPLKCFCLKSSGLLLVLESRVPAVLDRVLDNPKLLFALRLSTSICRRSSPPQKVPSPPPFDFCLVLRFACGGFPTRFWGFGYSDSVSPVAYLHKFFTPFLRSPIFFLCALRAGWTKYYSLSILGRH